MRNFQIKLTCDICGSENLRLRVSSMTLGIIFIFLGLQGIFDIFQMQMVQENNLKLYSALSLVFGIVFLLLSLLKTVPKNQSYVELSQA